MASIGSILSIARTAIAAHQTAMQVVSHNVANAQTEGYSRQRAELIPGVPQIFPYGALGTGVRVDDVARVRDSLLDANFRREAASAEQFGLRRDLLSQVEEILGEPSDQALSNALDAFWSSWSDLSNTPASATAQAVVRQRGIEVASTLNRFANRLSELEANTRTRLSASVEELNRLGSQLADLNGRITAAEVGGVQAPDLRDARDLVADQIAKLAGARLVEQSNGSLSFLVGGVAVVDGPHARAVEVRAGPPIALALAGSAEPFPQVDGALGAIVDVLRTDLPAVRAQLDALARGLVNGVNHLHESGWTAAGDALGGANWDPLNGPTGSRVSFFDPAHTTAGSITISASVAANAAVIASGRTENAPGDNAVALALGALRGPAGMRALATGMGATFAAQVGFADGVTFADRYRTTVTDVGLEVRAADSSAVVFETLTSQADTRRMSVNGVSIDEELTLMLRHQQAFQAASRLVRTADEMAQSLLEMV